MSEFEKRDLLQEVVDRLTYNGDEFQEALIELLEAHPKKYAPEYDLGVIGETIREHNKSENQND